MKLLCKESMCEIIKANIDSIIDFYLFIYLWFELNIND